MSISKVTAEKLANFLLTNRTKINIQAKEELATKAMIEYLKSLPKEVADLYNSGHKDYLNMTSYVQDPELDFTMVSFHTNVPSLRNKKDVFIFSGSLKKEINKIDLQSAQLKKDKEKLSNTIYSLRTPKRVQEIFSELIGHELLVENKPKTEIVSYEAIHKLYR